jgi:membrane protein required for colicin V production
VNNEVSDRAVGRAEPCFVHLEDYARHWLDTTILVLLGVGATFGAISGLWMQVARVIGLVVAVYCAVFFHEWATRTLEDLLLQGADPRVSGVLAYVLVFVVVYLAFHFASLGIQRWLKAAKLETMNRVLGGVLGTTKTALALGGIFLAMIHFPHPNTNDLMEKSAIAPVLATVAEVLVTTVPADQVEGWRSGVEDWRTAARTANESRRASQGD